MACVSIPFGEGRSTPADRVVPVLVEQLTAAEGEGGPQGRDAGVAVLTHAPEMPPIEKP